MSEYRKPHQDCDPNDKDCESQEIQEIRSNNREIKSLTVHNWLSTVATIIAIIAASFGMIERVNQLVTVNQVFRERTTEKLQDNAEHLREIDERIRRLEENSRR